MNANSKIRWSLLAAALLLVLAATILSVSQAVRAASGVPLPTVIGPIPVTDTSYPFMDRMGPPREAAQKAGYVEEEFFVSGMANVYQWDANGNAVVRTPNAPYTTRIIVRRPGNLHKFSGTVWVEPLNPTLAIDLDRMWQLHYEQILRDGDAYVGITAKPIAIVALQNFDPVRYGSLSMANPLPPDQQTCGRLPGEPGYSPNTSKLYENGLIWDIISQVGAALKSSESPIGAPAMRAYGEGWSQTGGYSVRYFNTFGPMALMGDGSRVYDGWLIGGATGATAINQCAAPVPATDPRSQFLPHGVPVIWLRTQGDFFSFAYRRADSDAPGDQFRLWELAGPTHDSITIFQNFAPDADIIKAGVTPPNPAVCNYQYITDLPYEYNFNAAAQALKAWVVDGIAPPHADRMVYDPSGNNVLDQYGNALGGVRTPYLDVPIWTYHMGAGPVFTCLVLGYKTPLSPDVIQQLYPQHGTYVSQVAQDTQRIVKEGFIPSYDASNIITQAAQAAVP